jgi:hypothetical protein
MFDLWRPPIIPSDTTAERSDSIAASMRDCERGADQRSDLHQRQVRHLRVRQRSADRPELAADGLDVEVHEVRERGSHDECDERPGNSPVDFRPDKNDTEAE